MIGARSASVTPADPRLVAHGLLAPLARSDPHRLLDVVDEHAPVAGLPGPSGPDDRLVRRVDDLVRHHRLDFQLGEQRDVGARPAVLLGVALLATAAHDLGDREPGHAELVEGVLDRLELLRADDRVDLLHHASPLAAIPAGTG